MCLGKASFLKQPKLDPVIMHNIEISLMVESHFISSKQSDIRQKNNTLQAAYSVYEKFSFYFLPLLSLTYSLQFILVSGKAQDKSAARKGWLCRI